MCGRTRCTLRADDIPRACHRNDAPIRSIHMDRYRPMYNVSPGSSLPVVRRDSGADAEGVVVQCMRWGLIPSFTKKSEKPDFYRMFNARSESISEKASFRRLLPKSRCVVAVEGFYEWKKDGSKKQPYYIQFKDGRPLVFAALYDSWQNSEGEVLDTFTIITTSSSSTLEWLHDRMPVILGDKASVDTWLNSSSNSKFDMVLKPYENPELIWYAVTPAMGKQSFDGPDCIKEIQLKAERKNSISKFFSGKETKKDEQSHQEVSQNDNKPGISVLQEKLKDEPQFEDQTGLQEHNDSKSGISKRNYDEFSTHSKPVKDEVVEPSVTPVTKKVNTKNALDKQPTLFSYFGKK